MKHLSITIAICCIMTVPAFASVNGRKLARASNGDLYYVYHRSDEYPTQIYCAKSTNDGQSWTETNISNNAYSQSDPAIAIDSLNHIHVVWQGSYEGSTGYQIRYAKYTDSWQSVENLTNETVSQYSPAIAVDSNNNVHITWRGRPGSPWSQIRYIKYTDSWQAIENLTNENYTQDAPSIAIDSMDHIHITWYGKYSDSGSYKQIRYIKYTDSWQAIENLTTPPDNEDQQNPCIAIDSNDNIHIVWYGTYHLTNDYWMKQIRYIKYTDSWGQIAKLSDIQLNQYDPSIAIDANDNIHVVWSGRHSRSTDTYQIRHRRYTTYWEPINNLTDEETDQTAPNLIWALHPIFVGARTNRPLAGYAFIWEDDSTFHYYESQDLVWAEPGELFNLNISTSGPGSVTKNPDKTIFVEGETVNLQATADPGGQFVNWSGDLSGGNNPVSIVMDSDKSITANFATGNYTLTSFSDNGTITRSPDKASYYDGEIVTLEVVPDDGYIFTGWSGDLSGSNNPTTIVMNSNKSVTANYTVKTYTLNVMAVLGHVTVNPNKMFYIHGETVTLQATASIGYHFTNWSGDLSGSNNPETLVMNSDKSITAEFALSIYTLDITATNGSVTKSPDKAGYLYGESVTVQAIPYTGHYFLNWSGDLSGAANPETVVMTSNKSITANCVPYTYTLTVTANNGSVTVEPQKAYYNQGETVILQAVPNSGYHFASWSGSLSGGTNPVTVTMDSNKSVTANFLANNPDETLPYVSNCLPDEDSIQNPVNSIITLHVADDGKGVDANTVAIRVNGHLIYAGNTPLYSSDYGNCRRTGTKADYTFIYQPNSVFDFEQKVTVTANARNLAGNAMDEYSYYFWTEMWSFGWNKKLSSNLDEDINERPATVSDRNGKIWAVWHAGPVGSRHIYLHLVVDGGYGYGRVKQVTSHESDQCNPDIALDDNGNIYIVWQDNYYNDWDIYAITTKDGITFSEITVVANSGDNETKPAIAIDHNSPNRCYVAYQTDENGDEDISLTISDDGLDTSDDFLITTDSSDQVDPAIAVDSDNVVYVAWTYVGTSSNDIYAAASNNSWQKVMVVGNVNNQSSPAIATEETGSILHWLWVDDTTGDTDIFYATTDGLPTSAVTGSSIIDDDKNTNQFEPSIVVKGSTGDNLKIYTCWTDRRNSTISTTDTDIYFAELTSEGKTNVYVDDDGKNAAQVNPVIDVDIFGYPYILWSETKYGISNVYYIGSTFLNPDAVESANVTASTNTIVGTNPQYIRYDDDVSVTLPANSCPCDLRITISEIRNRYDFFLEYLASYDFGPSKLNFNQPVTITIPYDNEDWIGDTYVFWYNPLTGLASQEGLSNFRKLKISEDIHAMQFETTHFTQFYLGYIESSYSGGGDSDSSGEGSGSGGGGCSLSAANEGNIIDFLLPYLILTIMFTLLKLRDIRNLRRQQLL